MMTSKNCAIVLIIFSSVFGAHAQTRKLLSGSMNGLKGQQSYNIKFSYDSMLVGKGLMEREYLSSKRKAWEEKEPGRGADFVHQWFDDRKTLYEPMFIHSFEKFANVKLGDKSAKYTIILKTKHTESGWYVGVAQRPAEIDGEMWIVSSEDQSKVIAKIGFYEFRGKNWSGTDLEMTVRIQSAYDVAGHGLGDYLKRKAR